jgi:predicted ribonuclease YlaK
MSDESNGWDLKALSYWEIELLLTDLEARTKKKYRQTTRQDYLFGLLCGHTQKQMSEYLHKTDGVVRTDLSNIYRDIETLTGEPENSVKSTNIIYVLERHGYRKGTAATSNITNRHIPHNLPAPTYTEFIGRDDEMQRLLQLLSPEHAAHIIMVDGIGGVGKTALVLAAAYLCLEASRKNLSVTPTFDAIIFTSAKQQYLDPDGILLRSHAQRNLRDIFREIAHALDDQLLSQLWMTNLTACVNV